MGRKHGEIDSCDRCDEIHCLISATKCGSEFFGEDWCDDCIDEEIERQWDMKIKEKKKKKRDKKFTRLVCENADLRIIIRRLRNERNEHMLKLSLKPKHTFNTSDNSEEVSDE